MSFRLLPIQDYFSTDEHDATFFLEVALGVVPKLL